MLDARVHIALDIFMIWMVELFSLTISIFLDSQIGKVDLDGQIEIWKSIQSKIFLYLPTFIFTKTFLSQISSIQDY